MTEQCENYVNKILEMRSARKNGATEEELDVIDSNLEQNWFKLSQEEKDFINNYVRDLLASNGI